MSLARVVGLMDLANSLAGKSEGARWLSRNNGVCNCKMSANLDADWVNTKSRI